jgi:hypothetical protein
MRVVFALLIMLAAAGCIGGSQAPDTGPNDAGMDALFTDALSHATPLPQQSEGAMITIPDITETTVTTATTATSSTTTSSTHTTTTVAKTDKCSDIQYPMGQRDCDRGYCPTDGYTCRYYPGSFASGAAKCVCFRVTTTTLKH